MPSLLRLAADARIRAIAVRTLEASTCAAGSALLLLYVAVACARMAYPFELEWMEGGVLDHTRRVLAGEKLYVEPSIGFVPFMYSPLYFYAAAVPAALFGTEFFAPRLLSFAASLGCFALIYAIVRRETHPVRLPAFIAACAFAGMFSLSGGWFDVARVDSLFLFFCLAGLLALRRASWVAAAVLLALSFLTKQTALAIAAPFLLYSWRFGVLFGVLVSASTLLLDHLHGGWYRYFVFEMGGRHAAINKDILTFWTEDMPPVAIAVLLSVPFLWSAERRTQLFYGLAAAGMIAASWISRFNTGGFPNVLLPAYAAAAILLGLGLHAAAASSRAAACAAAFAQLALLAWDPRAHLPSDEDAAAGRALVARIAETPGEVWVPYHGYLAEMAGKRGGAHLMAFEDLRWVGPDQLKSERLRDQLRAAIEARRFSLILLDERWPTSDLGIDQHYVLGEPLFSDARVFVPPEGLELRPYYLYTPRPAEPEEGGH